MPGFRRNRLAPIQARYFQDWDPDDAFILAKIQAAESELQRFMRAYFTPRQVCPTTLSPDQIAAYQAQGCAIIYEPGYDYDPKLFNGNSYGFIPLRQRPVSQVQAITFNYPDPTTVAYTIPNGWIRLDQKYGSINLLPIQTSSGVPLNAYLLSVFGGGSVAPFLIQIQYVCGLANARADYPDLIDLTLKKAVLSIMDDQMLEQSGSTSIDGMSQSLSLDVEKFRTALDQRAERIRQSMFGVRFAVM